MNEQQVYIDFVKMGARFDDATKTEYANIQGEFPHGFFFPGISHLLLKEDVARSDTPTTDPSPLPSSVLTFTFS